MQSPAFIALQWQFCYIKSNESRLVTLERKRKNYYNLPVNDGRGCKHLEIGQKLVALRMEPKMVNCLLTLCRYRNNTPWSWRDTITAFVSTAKLELIKVEVKSTWRRCNSVPCHRLEKQESKNSGHCSTCPKIYLRNYKRCMAEDPEKYGQNSSRNWKTIGELNLGFLNL